MDHSLIGTVFPLLDKSLTLSLQNRLDSFWKSAGQAAVDITLEQSLAPDLVKVFLFSEFVATSITRNPKLFKELIESNDLFKSYSEHTYDNLLDRLLSRQTKSAAVKQILLTTKLYETIRIAWRDLAGLAELEETLFDLSCLADAIVDRAVKTIYDSVAAQYGLPMDSQGNFQGLIVLGMGKLGARELNFSSDIDLIFVYPKDGYTNGENLISNEEFFTKVCRKFLKFFSAAYHEINFYRVDTRLRPYGDGGPLVMSTSAFEEYYQAQGREWERYAMIKARPIAGDIPAGFKLLKMLNSFIYRRYFDYGSFDSFRDMKHRITLQVKNKKLKNNIKLGAGGIREIEFFGQLFQLIRGGVEPKLQERPILKVLDLLQVHHCINAATKQDLKNAYIFLRMTENRLQAYADLQTHDIPAEQEQRQILALSMGKKNWDGFEKELHFHLEKVHHHFSQLLVSEEQEKQDKETEGLKQMWININDPQYIADSVAIGGFKEPERVLSILRSLEQHPNTKRLTSSGRKKLGRLVPVLVKKIGEKKDPDAVLLKLIDLIITIERRTCYLSLLLENKGALETLITLARKSPWIISFLSNHPALLDELMHPGTLYSPPDKSALEKEMETRMAGIPPDDLEFLLEELCIFRQINMLRVSAADVSGDYPLMKVSDHLTWIAETVLAQVLKISWHIVSQKYGIPDGIIDNSAKNCGFAIIVYGKVGGLEMGYKSDIDIVFLFDSDAGMTQGDQKSIDNGLFYSNLGQRIINALTMHTPAGTLYGADMRLRPGGNSGMIVSHIDAFEEYLNDQAWTWEHQALIRARPIAGDTKLTTRFETIRTRVLTKSRKESELKKEVADMRERMRRDRLKDPGDLFSLKQSPGGIVDIEFLVQYLVLNHADIYPDIIFWTDNMRLLESLDEQGIITGCESERLQNAYISMRKAIHRLNLQEKSLMVSPDLFDQNKNHVIEIYERYLAG
ncbi:MAG: bifunctional [glutamate--ammonia ligase]-adenylyl-L-tyrosine phosphorylase/[glutamate--ammonia-ligase] adenylyltransferase [Desulfobacula sp.]|nr:bifunctional [glutamate--ammonia ligase]-adenylyl-L-tyrosine phosphorylase/[glutamate--ammonia-ligase] adenylyltransferase [Desulfobacula sp.]